MAKNPTINSFTNLRGVDGEVQKIQALMSFSWLTNAFGMAEIISGVPTQFNSNTSDPQPLTPNDQWVDYCFWTYAGSGTVIYGDGMDGMIMRKGKPSITYPVSCIFYMRLPGDKSYKIEKTDRRQEVIEFFDTLIGYPGVVTPSEYIDHSIQGVFEGFQLGEKEDRWFQLPYYGLRVNMDITYKNYCA